MKRLLVPLLLTVAGIAGAWSGLERLRSLESGSAEEDLLYLPNGRYLRLASLGHASLAADLVYLWSIQYYSDYTRADRYRYVEHVFGSVIPELDPQYMDAYTLGSMILSVEARDLDGALRILDRGIEANPDQWFLPYLAGWECFRWNRFLQAAEYMEHAASMPGAPVQILRNRAGFVSRSGDLRGSYALWKELLDDPASDANTKAVAERQLRDLHVRIDLEDLRTAVERFVRRTGQTPPTLEELVSAGLMTRVPVDPDGNEYPYDRASGTIETVADTVLGDS